MNLESLIKMAYPDLREITFHSDGRIIAKTGGHAKHPKKLYSVRSTTKFDLIENVKKALLKLLEDNK